MGRNILIVLLILSFCFLGFSIGRYTYVPSVGPNVSVAKDIPDLKDMEGIDRALMLAVIASADKIAKEMKKHLESEDLSSDTLKVFQKALVNANKNPRRRGRAEEDPNKVYDVKIGDAPVRGPKNAPVTMIAFSEFQCPFCARAEKTTEQLLKDYDGKIKYVFRSYLLPMHSKAPLAHAAAYAAGRQGKFWEMHDKIFANNRQLDEDTFKGYAQELGLNMAKFEKDMKDPDISKEWEDDKVEAGKQGVRSTPTFFINGKMVRGAKPIEEFKKVIDEALKQAQK